MLRSKGVLDCCGLCTPAIFENNMNKEKEERKKMNQAERRKKQMAYIADQECVEEMNACKRILHELNTVDRTDGDAICEIVKRLFGKADGALPWEIRAVW